MSDWDKQKHDEEWAFEQKARVEFLRQSAALPMPAEVYAIWLELFLRQGGQIRYNRKSDFSRRSASNAKHEDIHTQNWVPTRDGGQIPANYGSAAMTLLILPEVTHQQVYPATSDRRSGWEWGHTTVLSIVEDSSTSTGFLAETSDPYGPDTYPDIEKIRKGMQGVNLNKMLVKYGMIQKDMFASEAWVDLLAEAPEEDTRAKEIGNLTGYFSRLIR